MLASLIEPGLLERVSLLMAQKSIRLISGARLPYTLSNEANTPLDLAREVLDTSTRVDRAKVLELLVAAGGLRWAQLEGSDSDSDSSSSSSSDDDNDDNDNEDEDDDGDSDFSALYTLV